MQNKAITIVNKLGLHARAAARFVQLASSFDCEINVSNSGKKVNGKSIMGIMMLAAARGAVVDITTTGADETEAMIQLEALIIDRFGEAE